MKNIAIIIIMVMVTLTSWGNNKHPHQQNKRTIEQKTTASLSYLTIVLDLNDRQVDQIKTIQATHIGNVKSIKDQYQPILDQMKSELQNVRQSTKDNQEIAKEKAKLIRDKYKSQLSPMKEKMKLEKEKLNGALVKILDSQQADKYLQLQELKKSRKSDSKKGNQSPPRK